MKDSRTDPRWVDFRNPRNPHGLRFAEGEDGGTSEPKPTPPPSAAETQGQKVEQKAGDEPLGEPGKKALDAEREARKALEGQMSQMREAFAAALGTKADKKTSVEDMVAQLQEQFTTLQRSNLVSTIARENSITDADDIATIAEASTEEGMRRIATRLAAANEPGTPKPDRSQGGKQESASPDPGKGVPRLSQAFEDIFATK